MWYNFLLKEGVSGIIYMEIKICKVISAEAKCLKLFKFQSENQSSQL
jgi:hypothetical protein